MEFAEGTSVGAGQVLEFYVNFGLFGSHWWIFLVWMAAGFVGLADHREPLPRRPKAISVLVPHLSGFVAAGRESGRNLCDRGSLGDYCLRGYLLPRYWSVRESAGLSRLSNEP